MKAEKKGGQVIARAFESITQEAKTICDEIQKRIDSDTSAHDISILVRSAYRAEVLHAGLVQRGIPYSNWLAASYNSSEQRQVRICLAVVRPILTQRACRYICELLGIGEVPDSEIINTEEFLQMNKSLPGAKQLLAVRYLADSKARVGEIVREIGTCIEAIDPQATVAESLVTEVAAFEAHDPEYSLDHLLADLALGGKGGAPTEGGGVKLATIHRTKGLQWPHVYLIGLEGGHLPHYLTETEEQLREERRLCFVGVCRAEDSLTLTRIQEYRGHSKAPSPFLRELGVKEVCG